MTFYMIMCLPSAANAFTIFHFSIFKAFFVWLCIYSIRCWNINTHDPSSKCFFFIFFIFLSYSSSILYTNTIHFHCKFIELDTIPKNQRQNHTLHAYILSPSLSSLFRYLLTQNNHIFNIHNQYHGIQKKNI